MSETMDRATTEAAPTTKEKIARLKRIESDALDELDWGLACEALSAINKLRRASKNER
jgi:hypothetical protein